MIKINHIALNVNDIDYMKEFYCKMFNLQANDLYVNYKKKVQCYFLSFNSEFTRLELVKNENMADVCVKGNSLGFSHISFSMGSKENIEHKIDELIRNYTNIEIIEKLRITGDGSFFASFTDPEGNLVELTT